MTTVATTPGTGPARQVKSWNLSSVLRLPTRAGWVWCKHVPAFLGHEGAVLTAVRRADPDLVPDVLAHRRDPDGTSVTLLEHVPGEDQWHAPGPVLAAMARRWVAVQARWASDVEQLLALGLPDGRFLKANVPVSDVVAVEACPPLSVRVTPLAGLPAESTTVPEIE